MKTTLTHSLFLLITLGLIAACQLPSPPAAQPELSIVNEPSPTAEPVAGRDSSAPAAQGDALQAMRRSARAIAAEALAVDAEAVSVLEVEPVDWNDSSLGCPQSGYMYAQVITPGFRATVEVEGEVHRVHLDAQGRGLLCPEQ